MQTESVDLLIIGSGPGGYVGAIRASQLGLKTAVIERAELGGVCLNWGCIPTKALLKSAEVVESFHKAKEYGIAVDGFTPDFPAIIKRSRDVSKRVSMGVGYLFKKNKIPVLRGSARFLTAHEIGIFDEAGNETVRVQASRTIVATGGRPMTIPGIDIDGKKVIGYREAMTLETLPQSMIVIGAGAIGMEFSSFYRALGTEITVVEMLENVLPIEDVEVSKVVARSCRKRKIKTLCRHVVEGIDTSGDGVAVRVKNLKKDEETVLNAELALMSIGVRGNSDGLGLEELGIEMNRSFIKVGDGFRTSVEGVYAIGDIIGPPLLAHVASHEAILCVEGMAGLDPAPLDYDAIPGCTFCTPQVGSIGLSEEKAREREERVRVGKFAFMGVGKAVALGERDGFVKLIFDDASGKLLGGHVVGPEAAEIVGELELAMAAGVTDRQIGHAVHSHPTLHEAVLEAALDAQGRAIHQ